MRCARPIVLSLPFVLLVGCAQAAAVRPTTDATRSLVAGWPETPRQAATAMIQKYGTPHEVTPTMLVWHNNGQWKRTIVYREEIPHSFPMAHIDALEQFIDYRVPLGRYDEMARYDGSVIVERTKGEVSARCDVEEMNFLALNLANDVASGRRTVEDARAFYAREAMAFKEGRGGPYTRGFQFPVPRGGTADPDTPVVPTR